MTHMHPGQLTLIAGWPDTAQHHFGAMRALFLDVAAQADIGPLEESLKWGQPAWRPRKPRTGSTLRLDWSRAAPDRLMAYVDCKTDLADQMAARFPCAFHNDGRRSLGFDLDTDLPTDAVRQLAHLTFTYHLTKRQTA
ncbi:hypothetical protein [uncultured Tateyamaria sp.]|uniref:hypothetical protein n=1 Tax=uncultured Tateyamaria sp. TaxID=455651 RepID=UPI00262E3058|nr:hypothetical protein [uncultured Tateyamaria sp.]